MRACESAGACGGAELAFPSALRSKVERMRTELETERLELEHRLLAQVPHPLGSPLFLSSPLCPPALSPRHYGVRRGPRL